jgi:hypothetical protein
MFRLPLALCAGLLGLVAAAGAGPAPPREADDRAFAPSEQGDLILVLQKDKEKKHYSVNKRIASLKGKTGVHHIGTTKNGRHIDAHVKNGKVHKMELQHKGGKKVAHSKVVKAKNKPALARQLPKPAKRASLTPGRELDADAEVVRTQFVGFVGFVFVLPAGIWVIWLPATLVVPTVVDDAVEESPCGELEVRATVPAPPGALPAPGGRALALAALSPRRQDRGGG